MYFIIFLVFDDLSDRSNEYVYHVMKSIHIRTTLRYTIIQLFIIAIRMHSHLSGGCLVHLHIKRSVLNVSLYNGASVFIVGFHLRTLVVIKAPLP